MDKEKAGVRRDLLHEAENRDKIIVKTSVIVGCFIVRYYNCRNKTCK